ncbi:type I-G CRISPR-associated helicase/endonuclease Cas3g [Lujinxingia litoralis]|nr:CRISPR-associated endonuclease Cas3'' [Lujinxingia litoralis]
MGYVDFFQALTGAVPYPYQCALSEGGWPDLVDVPTGLGKTAAIGVAWLYRRSLGEADTPRRLVWCLPMRSLVEQTHAAFSAWVEKAAEHFEQVPTVNMLMGGNQELDWAQEPERDAVIIGTQDMLLSRALMRGYGMSRYAWPMHYAWLHNDALWVFDETQLMGVSVPTSAQLQGFRDRLGTARPTHSIWMSATLSARDLHTVDHRPGDEGWRTHRLGSLDEAHDAVRQRTGATKALHKAPPTLTRDVTKNGEGLEELAAAILDAHIDDSLTLVVLNRVSRAQMLFEELQKVAGDVPVTLLHSRFRAAERGEHARALQAPGGRIIVATQVIEAGVDISARTLFSELAPWPSFVQRVGRCNRYGEFDDARVFWIDLRAENEKDGDVLLPYTFEELNGARTILSSLDDVGPERVRAIDWQPPQTIYPVLRRRDLLELFDTTADLSGNDLDVSRYIREGNDTDVSFFWRALQGEPPHAELPEPRAEELCRVAIGPAKDFATKDKKKSEAWRFDPLGERWVKVTKLAPPRPGEVLLVDSATGGYDPQRGFIGLPKGKFEPVPELRLADEASAVARMNDDPRTYTGAWQSLAEHSADVVAQAEQVAEAFELPERWQRWLLEAARWHDVGKSHPVFQQMLLTPAAGSQEPPADPDILWAKSAHRRGRYQRKYFRHELASALAFLAEHPPGRDTNAVAYMIAAHHGKVRLSLRSLPAEDAPEDGRLFARGVHQGDALPVIPLDEATTLGPFTLDLSPMRLGQGSWLERCLDLRDAPELGPFCLAWLESLLRLADQRASALATQEAR